MASLVCCSKRATASARFRSSSYNSYWVCFTLLRRFDEGRLPLALALLFRVVDVRVLLLLRGRRSLSDLLVVLAPCVKFM